MQRSKMRGLAGCVVAVIGGASAVASAGNGVREINQSCAALGCDATDGAGFPIETEAWKAYVLTSDLVVPDANTHGIILAEGASLDLNGFSLRGPTQCSGVPATCTGSGTGIGVLAFGFNTIRNGTIARMGSHGLQSGDGLLLEQVRVVGNGGDGVNAGFGSQAISIRGNMIFRNGGIGLNMNFGSPGGGLIEGNVIYANGSDGIRGNLALVRGNRVSSNGGLGLSVSFGGEGTAFGENQFTNNNGGGANPQTSGGAQVGVNVCRNGTTCP